MTIAQVLPPLFGGALIGLAALVLLALNGRVMGVSGIFGGIVNLAGDWAWRAAFLAGCIAAPLLLALTGHSASIQVDATLPVLVVAGLLVGFGTALGSGCTSGHGICGISRLSPRSVVATGIFMVVAIATVAIVRHLIQPGAA